MKKFAVLLSGVLLLMNSAFAGGILTNTNQSAQFVRMLSRNASTDLDAVYFNPAGLTQLKNGFYFGLHNQTITQTKTISSGFPKLKFAEYIGDVKAPVFPTAFAVYKIDNWAFSAGFGPNGGGGSADYANGLPSFEKQIGRLVPALSSLSLMGITPPSDYNVDISFEGTSVFWGIQVGATYKINDMISVYGGARYLPSTNTYKGSITNIQLGPLGATINGKTFLTNAAAIANAKAVATAAGAASLQPLVSGGAGSLTTAQARAMNIINDTQKAQIEGGLKQLGLSDAEIAGITIASAQSKYSTTSATLAGAASQLTTNSAGLGDKYVDTKQTGSGITPIIGINIHLDKLNIGLKYEHQTKLELTNATVVDDTNPQLFPDKGKSRSDIPGIIAGGADYKVLDNLKVSGSFNIYLDKSVNWGKNIYMQDRTIDKNYVELACGLEYNLTKNFAVSAGYMNSNTGVSEQYQSDFSYSNDSYTVGLGFQWNLSKKLVFDAGAMITTYKDDTKSFTEAAPIGTYTETYGKDTFTFAFGIGYKIF
jgi:long-subunit fatty acid transport protein